MALNALGTTVRPSTLRVRERSVLRAIEVMKKNLEEPTTLAEVAGQAFMSRFHFNRVFREITGIPPIRFLFALRIQRAKELLLTTDRRVIDICYAVGYSSLGSFGNSFHRRVGVAPRAFRKLGNNLCKNWVDFRLAQQESVSNGEPLPGLLVSPQPIDGPVFITFIRSQAPFDLPVACAGRIGAGPFRVPSLPNGRYTVRATATAWNDGPLALCLQEHGWRGEGCPTSFRNGAPATPIRIAMQPATRADPPILPSPALLRFPPTPSQTNVFRLHCASTEALGNPAQLTLDSDDSHSHHASRLHR